MRLLIPALVLLSTLAVAQEMPTRGPATGDPTANSTTPRTYRGCVIRSNGSVMLADASNQDYILVSSGHSLDSYVGQEVTIRAANVNPSDPSSDERGINAEQPVGQPMTLNVEDIQKTADHCTSPASPDKTVPRK
jgi:hypothetical protein